MIPAGDDKNLQYTTKTSRACTNLNLSRLVWCNLKNLCVAKNLNVGLTFGLFTLLMAMLWMSPMFTHISSSVFTASTSLW